MLTTQMDEKILTRESEDEFNPDPGVEFLNLIPNLMGIET